MEKEQNLAENLAKLNGLEHYSVNEMAVITAVRDGANTIPSVAESTGIPEAIVENLVQSLQNNLVLVLNVDEAGTIYLKNVNSEDSSKKMTLKGCLQLPVTSFHDADGKRWVCRGKWYEIPEDLNILDDIVWVDSVDEDEEMKSILRQISNTQQKRNAKAAKNVLKDDEPAAAEDIKYQSSWVQSGTNCKMWVYAISANHANVAYSPRFVNEVSGNEFPFGIVAEKVVIGIQEFRQRVSGEYEQQNGVHQFDGQSLLKIDGKKNLFVSWDNETVASFIEFKSNKDETITATHLSVDVLTKSVSKPKKKDIISQEEVVEYVKTHAPQTAEFLGL